MQRSKSKGLPTATTPRRNDDDYSWVRCGRSQCNTLGSRRFVPLCGDAEKRDCCFRLRLHLSVIEDCKVAKKPNTPTRHTPINLAHCQKRTCHLRFETSDGNANAVSKQVRNINDHCLALLIMHLSEFDLLPIISHFHHHHSK